MSRKSLVAVALFLVISSVCWGADQGAALYKKKCAGCHGAAGEGKPAAKAPALKGTQMDASQIVDQVTKGKPDAKAPHQKRMSGINEAHAKTIAEYIKSLP